MEEQVHRKEFEFTSRSYRFSRSAGSENSFQISVPTQILRHEAEVNGMSIGEFVKKFEMVARYNDDRPSGYIIYEFRRV